MVLEAVRLSTQDEAARCDEAEVVEAVRQSSQDDALRRAREENDRAQLDMVIAETQEDAELARALAQEAHVLLLDEPFTGLDRNASESLATLLRELAGEGRLILCSHHDLDSAPALFNECLLLNHSQIGFGPTPEVLTPGSIRQAFAL